MNTNDELAMKLHKLIEEVHPDLLLLLSLLLDLRSYRHFTFWDFDRIFTDLENQDFEIDISDPNTDSPTRLPLFSQAKDLFIQRITDSTNPHYERGGADAVLDNNFNWLSEEDLKRIKKATDLPRPKKQAFKKKTPEVGK
jgi:hypothetical protein